MSDVQDRRALGMYHKRCFNDHSISIDFLIAQPVKTQLIPQEVETPESVTCMRLCGLCLAKNLRNITGNV